MTKKPGTIFWDFDGTLIYTRPMWSAAFVDAVKTHFPDKDIAVSMMAAKQELLPGGELTIDAIRPHLQAGFPWHKPEIPHLELNDPIVWWSVLEAKFKAIFIALGFDSTQAEAMAKKTHENVVRPEIYVPYDDAIRVLKELKAKGWKHIILSNHVPELPQIMEKIGFGGLFDTILTSATTGYEKPHPEMFRLAKEAAAGQEPFWMVGDNLKADIAGAEAAGVPAILVHKPDMYPGRQARNLVEVAVMIEEGQRG